MFKDLNWKPSSYMENFPSEEASLPNPRYTLYKIFLSSEEIMYRLVDEKSVMPRAYWVEDEEMVYRVISRWESKN